jgi:hypothetical protein
LLVHCRISPSTPNSRFVSIAAAPATQLGTKLSPENLHESCLETALPDVECVMRYRFLIVVRENISEVRVRACLAAMESRLTGAVPATRQTLREILNGTILLGADGHFEGELVGGRLLTGQADLSPFVVRPAGLEPATPGLEAQDHSTELLFAVGWHP